MEEETSLLSLEWEKKDSAIFQKYLEMVLRNNMTESARDQDQSTWAAGKETFSRRQSNPKES